MSDWFNELNTHGRNFVAAGRAKNSWEGVYRSIVDKYPDPIHFVYELLQNADDQAASEVSFTLTRTSLVFQHDGNPFTRKDVEHITEIGNSDKSEEGNKIGRYGIGFKSVYSVTDCPQIFTRLDDQPFAFQIEDLVVPEKLPITADHPQNESTRFVLPFKPERAELIYDQLVKKLRTLGADTIMFLNHLRLITWQVEEENGIYLCERPDGRNGICYLEREVFLHNVLSQRQETHYLQYSRKVGIEGDRSNLSVSIAFLLVNGQVVEEKEKSLNVYFPTSRDTRLKFRLHAPMLLTPDRANIRENEQNNLYLIRECATLLAETLPKLRDAGKLTMECLNCLPIRRQDFPDSFFFWPLYNAVCKQLRSQEPLLPTIEGSSLRHVTISHAKIAESSSVRSLLPEEQLTQLHGLEQDTPVCWLAVTSSKGATADLWAYLKTEMLIVEFDNAKLASMLHKPFLMQQSDEWLIRFYTTARQHYQAQWEKGRPEPHLRRKPIIRLEDGTHVVPFNDNDKPQAYLPLAIGGMAEFPTIKSCFAQNDGANEFLQALGLAEPDKVDVVLEHILPKYKDNVVVRYKAQEYHQHIALIGQAVEEALRSTYPASKRSELQAGLMRTKFILAANAANMQPDRMAAKDVLQRTGELLTWFADNPETWFVSEELQRNPAWQSIQDFINRHGKPMKETIQVRAELPDRNGHIVISSTKPYQRGLNGFDPNATIDGLRYAVQNINRDRARLLWNLLLSKVYLLTGKVETSSDRQFSSSEEDTRSSKIYDACHDAAWLPDKQGKLCKPRTLILADLPHDFDKNSPSAHELAKVLGFKHAAEMSDEEKFTKEFNLPPGFFAYIKSHPEDARKWFTNQQFATFSSGEPASTRRLEKLAARQEDAPFIQSEQKLRLVRTSSPDIHTKDKEHLRLLYEKDGRMQCQICCNQMPFQINGEDYFEAVQCIKTKAEQFKKEPLVNRLALCPTCAAKYLYANEYYGKWEALRQAILCLNGNEFPIILAGSPHKIHFKRQHLDELKTVF